MADLDRRCAPNPSDDGEAPPDGSAPGCWHDITRYLGPFGDAWKWGYCDAGARERLRALGPRVADGSAEPAELDQLLMAWQVLRGFPVEYGLPVTA